MGTLFFTSPYSFIQRRLRVWMLILTLLLLIQSIFYKAATRNIHLYKMSVEVSTILNAFARDSETMKRQASLSP